MSQKPVAVPSELVVPHRIVKVGVATTGEGAEPADPVPADTVVDPVGRRAIAQANEEVRDLPKREKIIKVGRAGELTRSLSPNGAKVPNLIPDAIGEVYPGEHRYAYQLQPGDKILILSGPTPEMGRWVKVDQVQLLKVDDSYTDAEIQGVGEAGYPVILNMASNAQIRLVTDQEEPYG